MKLRLLLASICVVSATGSVFSMDPQSQVLVKTEKKIDRYLLFILNHKYEITEYGLRNMEFLVPPKEFLGKVITDAVPLDTTDKEAITQGLQSARKHKELRKVPYALQDIKFVAAIRYQKGKKEFSVKVRESEIISS